MHTEHTLLKNEQNSPLSELTKLSPVSDADRLGFTLFMAIAFHVLLIFGLGFDSLAPDASAKLIEVTLTAFKNDKVPDDADFLAQHNQQGSGTLQESAQLSTDRKSIYQDNLIRDIQLKERSMIKADRLNKQTVINTDTSEQTIQSLNKYHKNNLLELDPAKIEQLKRKNNEIASLQAKLDEQKQLYAKGPKTRQITSVSAIASDDAAYINSVREKIEYIGNKYYPKQAKTQKLEGDVQLLVALKANGEIHQISLLKSSNHTILDRAAINSVRLAAPYPSFTKAMRSDTDILEIIRTWQFRSETLKTRS